jgi:photosystem II stability/assembly factor-like uncharacterized protein
MTEDSDIQDIVYALAASPQYARDGICFAACQSGLRHSRSGGTLWHDAYSSLNLQAPLMTLSVAVSPSFEADATVFAGVAGGILRSFDGGETWLPAELPSPPPTVSSMVISPDYANDGILFAATIQDGVFCSHDRGSRWAAWNFGLLDLNVFCMDISSSFAQDETLFVGTESGVYRSTNGGRAWQETSFPIDSAPVISLALSPAYASDRTLFAGTESSGLFRTDDEGGHWEDVGGDALCSAINAIVLSPEFPSRPDILVMLDDTLLISRDGGTSWSAWPMTMSQTEMVTAVATPQGIDRGAPLLVGLADGNLLRI